MQQAHDDVGILLAPAAVVGVEAVDAVEIGAPDREIAGARAAPGASAQPAQRPERQMQQRRQPVDAAAQAFAPANAPKLQLSGVSFSRSTLRRQFRRQQNAVAGDEAARFGQTAMRGDEIRPRDAVAVEEDAVGAARGEDRAVADLGGAEAAVLVPDVIEAAADLAFPGFDQSPRSPAREPSSATITSKSASLCRASERSTASSASSRL